MTTLETSLEEIDGLEGFEVYPNPIVADKPINIELQSNKYLEGVMSLHNAQGQIVYSNTIIINGINRHEIKTADLPSGLYIVNIDFLNATTIQKKVLIISQ